MKEFSIISIILGFAIGLLLGLHYKLYSVGTLYNVITNIVFWVGLIASIILISALRIDYKLTFLQYFIGCIFMIIACFIGNSIIKLI